METLPHDGIAEALACDPATRRSCHADSDSQPVAILDLGEGGGVEQQRQPEAVAERGGQRRWRGRRCRVRRRISTGGGGGAKGRG
jgi:hypothetical protein